VAYWTDEFHRVQSPILRYGLAVVLVAIAVIFALALAIGEEVAIDALKVGATDYVLKTRLSRLVPAVRRALRETHERASRQRAENALRRREKELRDVVEAIPAIAASAAALLRSDSETGIDDVGPLSSRRAP
jgi:DNA-binding NtrC family response regulator